MQYATAHLQKDGSWCCLSPRLYISHTCYPVRFHLIEHEADSIHEQKRLHFVRRSGMGDFQSGFKQRQIAAARLVQPENPGEKRGINVNRAQAVRDQAGD